MRVTSPVRQDRTENFNLMVQVEADPDRVEIIDSVA